MKELLSEKLYNLSRLTIKKTGFPLYVVGGFVRNFLICGQALGDIDLAASVPAETFAAIAEEAGYFVAAVYKRTGTAVIVSEGEKYEYTSFRKEVYERGGGHSPVFTEPTLNIEEDALRRDFKCNNELSKVKAFNGREAVASIIALPKFKTPLLE